MNIMKNKLKIKETEKPDKGPCEHDTTHMVDLLAGEISDKDRDTLSEQLNSCKECQDQLAELSQTWQLTAEILKGDTEFGVQSSEFQVEDTETPDTPSTVSIPEGDKHPTKEVAKAETVKKTSRIQESLKRKNLKKKYVFVKEKIDNAFTKHKQFHKQFKFAWTEIAASFVVVFIILFLLTTVKVFEAPKESKSISSFDYESEADYGAGEPAPNAGDVSFFQITGGNDNSIRRFVGRLFESDYEVPKGEGAEVDAVSL